MFNSLSSILQNIKKQIIHSEKYGNFDFHSFYYLMFQTISSILKKSRGSNLPSIKIKILDA